MSDIVEWLRASQAERDQVILVDASLLWRAADEIEKLRAALELADAKLGGEFAQAGAAEVRAAIAKALWRG